MIGIVVFGIELQNTTAGVWSVLPLIGVAISFFGVQMIATITYCYCIESQPPHLAPRVPLFIGFFRGLLAFSGPFYVRPENASTMTRN